MLIALVINTLLGIVHSASEFLQLRSVGLQRASLSEILINGSGTSPLGHSFSTDEFISCLNVSTNNPAMSLSLVSVLASSGATYGLAFYQLSRLYHRIPNTAIG